MERKIPGYACRTWRYPWNKHWMERGNGPYNGDIGGSHWERGAESGVQRAGRKVQSGGCWPHGPLFIVLGWAMDEGASWERSLELRAMS